MKTKLLSLIYCCCFCFLFSQEMISFKNQQNIIRFKISENEYFATFSETNKSLVEVRSQNNNHRITNNSMIITMKDLSGSFVSRKQKLKDMNGPLFNRIEPVLIYEDGTKQMLNGQINIKVISNIDVKTLIKKWNFKIDRNLFDKNLYLLSSDVYTTSEIFEIVNELQNKKEIEFVEPNFIRLIEPQTNDPYFTSQWAIKNEGYYGGTVGADMKVEEAWNYATGSGIKVAIIDEGVDLNHPDLSANMLLGYDATGNNSNGAPNLNNHDAHGTACAGIVSAIANNNIGITGIAYDSKILPVRIAYSNGLSSLSGNRKWITDDTWIANGINWAWQNGADILSNSWGGGSYSSTVVNAINAAVYNGRNGKGAVVLFSSGNKNQAVFFPARQNNVIAVGASSMCDERKSLNSCDGESWWGSNYGEGLNVIAPGVKIYTTDISGSEGYTSGDYSSDFNGTSSACPNVAGVVALILSINPNLTHLQVKEYLERNADKIRPDLYSYKTNSLYPNGTWNDKVGYGRVNALKAVEDVIFSNIKIEGSNYNCNSQQTYTLSQSLNNVIPVWSHSSNLTKNNETPTSITVTPNANNSGNAFIKATIGSKEIIKNFWIGTPQLIYDPHCSKIEYDGGKDCFNICFGSSAQFTVFSDQSLGSNVEWEWEKMQDDFRWSINGNTVFVLPNKAGFPIGFRVRAKSDCGWTPWLFYVVNVKDCNGGGSQLFQISPNPTSGILNIITKTNETANRNSTIKTSNSVKPVLVEVYDNLGNLKIQKTLKANESSINIQHLPTGTYMVKITKENNTETHQVIKK
ncbi:MAG: S8 family serine peptidase [Cruoricaptor ignavus]|nr:S8 family serine peptidase [Cruoricaptor ignavus]